MDGPTDGRTMMGSTNMRYENRASVVVVWKMVEKTVSLLAPCPKALIASNLVPTPTKHSPALAPSSLRKERSLRTGWGEGGGDSSASPVS